ncbi:Cysteine-rich secretory protein family protein [Aquisphaera giovannonii]|uniref:Cysteine-rich secretory protein family protein n=1 Tax=Aquisphaera giovannonii TaxID=406548 RepID=A0A5B9W1G4_9BACT|nr:CAP domain-containing protein [Aquisphaera giovannonii]QEH33845.1 Cysteine-rich secretory protein family protein [Aquisphaera giovannonii]
MARGAVAASIQYLRNGPPPLSGGMASGAASPTTPSSPAPSVASTSISRDPAAVIRQVIDLTNQARVADGLQPLAPDASLADAAAIHSADMARLGRMSHDLPGVPYGSLSDRAAHVGYDYQSLGENIAYNQPDAPSVVEAWLNSPPHRENMLSPDLTQIGVGVAWSGGGEPYYTMELGKPA